ncbi:hypothetical protein BFINE_40190 [Bacteroides finegoldii DSM 17565]|nr:hypothetical protein BFINE_40190 [Bacteroides finegoldii DSM 17565]
MVRARCTVFHKESQSTGQLSRLRTYYLTRNRLLYARRNLREPHVWAPCSIKALSQP